MHPHVDPLDQKLHDPRLLGRKELVPQRRELGERVPCFTSAMSSCSARAETAGKPLASGRSRM